MQERREGTKGERDISEEVIRRTGELGRGEAAEGQRGKGTKGNQSKI